MNLLAGLHVFVRVVELGSFSAVAREINASHSAVTRQIGQLEDHFSVRLFHRTTRKLGLTDDGSILLDHARRMLEDAAAMEGQLGQQRVSPKGQVRVALPGAVALYIVPRLSLLLRRYPGLSVDLVVDDKIHDLVETQTDIAFRVGQNADSTLIARSLGSFRWVFVASPEYLRRAGEPKTPEELTSHECIIQSTMANRAIWRFGTDEAPLSIRVSGALMVNESEVARRAVLAGHGIARVSGLLAIDDIREGRLVPVLADFRTAPVPIYLVYPSRRHLAPRTRVVMEFLAEQLTDAAVMMEGSRRENIPTSAD
jgi:DNA-binding transcriptional LysR family regulator